MDLCREIQQLIAPLVGMAELCVVDIDNNEIMEVVCRDREMDVSKECADVVEFLMRMFEISRQNGTSEDIVLTTNRFYKVVRVINNNEMRPVQFIYAVLDRSTANIVFARRKLIDIELLLETRLGVGMRRSPVAIHFAAGPAGHNFAAGVASPANDEDDIPPFMREDAVLRLLGIQAA